MTPERRAKMANWLETLAEAEELSASVLSKVPSGDPTACLNKARLFHELARHLREPDKPDARPEPVSEGPTSRKDL
jgi:hypothetical protein